MFSKILVATDGSDHAERALVVAGDLASRFDADLVVVNVFLSGEISDSTRHIAEVEHLMPVRRRASGSDLSVPGAVGGLPIEPVEESDYFGVMYQASEKIGQRVADDGAKAARKAGATKVKSVARDGDPAETILGIAKDEKADLVVLGSRGFSRLKGLLMGSVSRKVADHAGCTCVIVK
jgi:nucleotide-binding universal stress UspA family protein